MSTEIGLVTLIDRLVDSLCHLHFEWLMDVPQHGKEALLRMLQPFQHKMQYIKFLCNILQGGNHPIPGTDGAEDLDRYKQLLDIFINLGDGQNKEFDVRWPWMKGEEFSRLLNPTEWINDAIINQHRDHINRMHSDVLVWDTYFVKQLEYKPLDDIINETFRKTDISRMRKVFFPLHLSIHWAFIEVDFVTNYIRYFDSLGGRGSSKTYLQRVNTLMQRLFELRGYGPFPEMTLEFNQAPQQINGNDCGLYTMKMIENRVLNAEVMNITPEDIVRFRQLLILHLIEPYDYMPVCPVWPHLLESVRRKKDAVEAGPEKDVSSPPVNGAEFVPHFIELMTPSGYARAVNREILIVANSPSVWLQKPSDNSIFSNVYTMATLTELAKRYISQA
jgi:hypothetical protein